MPRKLVSLEYMDDVLFDDDLSVRPKRQGYVQGKYADVSPFSSLLWCELRHAYAELHIKDEWATIFEYFLLGMTYKEIGKLFRNPKTKKNMSDTTISYRIITVKQKLMNYKNLGLFTVILEECGGWDAVSELLYR